MRVNDAPGAPRPEAGKSAKEQRLADTQLPHHEHALTGLDFDPAALQPRAACGRGDLEVVDHQRLLRLAVPFALAVDEGNAALLAVQHFGRDHARGGKPPP